MLAMTLKLGAGAEWRVEMTVSWWMIWTGKGIIVFYRTSGKGYEGK